MPVGARGNKNATAGSREISKTLMGKLQYDRKRAAISFEWGRDKNASPAGTARKRDGSKLP